LLSCFDSIESDNQYGGKNIISELAKLPSSNSISEIADEKYNIGT